MSDEDILREFFESVAWPEGVTTSKQTKGGRAALEALTRLIATKEQAEKERDDWRHRAKRLEFEYETERVWKEGAERERDALTARLRSMCEAMQGAEWVLSQSETYTIGLMVTCRMTQKQIHNSDVLANIRKAASTIRAELDAAKKDLAQPAHPENRPCP